MDKEIEKYYENYFDLFLHPGWKQYIEDLGGTEVAAQSVVNKSDAPDVFRAQGELACIRRLRNFEELQRNGYDEILRQEKEEEAQVDIDPIV